MSQFDKLEQKWHIVKIGVDRCLVSIYPVGTIGVVVICESVSAHDNLTNCDMWGIGIWPIYDLIEFYLSLSTKCTL